MTSHPSGAPSVRIVIARRSGGVMAKISFNVRPCKQCGDPVRLIKRSVKLEYHMGCMAQRHLAGYQPP